MNKARDLFSAPSLNNSSNFAEQLHGIFQKHSFHQKTVIKRLGGTHVSGIKESDIPELLYRTRQGSSLDTLIRLFLMEIPVPCLIAEDILSTLLSTSMLNASFLRREDDHLVSQVKIIPFEDFYTCFDSPTMLYTSARDQYVMGVGASTATLANLTVRSQSQNTLDLGAGCGFHAILATSHSDKVVALDLNQRAVGYSEFNARLNNLNNIQCCAGDLFEPVQGQQFDLIVSNPPFVISPEKEYIYRDGGMVGDGLIQKICKQAPEYLSEGGFCQILCNWAEIQDENWQERLQKWFDNSDCDVLVLRLESRDAATYASTWIRHTEKADQEHYQERFNRWMDYFKQEHISSVGAGCIIIRKQSEADNWFAAETVASQISSPCGDQILRKFAAKDFLNTLPNDEALLKTVLHPAPELILEEQSTPKKNGGWNNAKFSIRLDGGIPSVGEIDSTMADFIKDTSHGRTLKKHLKKLARTNKQHPEEIQAPFLKMVRHLVEKGFLLPREILI